MVMIQNHCLEPERELAVIMLKVDRPKTLKENALESLRDAITKGILKPGERLVERSLCESMAVSRTVVRECIRHLESEWLVVGTPNSGFAVATITHEEVAEIYQIRIMLECAAVQSCALKADAETVRQLRELNKKIDQCLQLEDVIEALKLTTEFYHIIFTTGGNTVSWTLTERLNGRISCLRALTLSSKERKNKGPANLSSIVDAIEQRDTKLAKKVCARHLNEAAQIALQQI
jgi:DNA-binding GntR family transcriptional regulator